jgi:unsaturated rhamnogalacturonyl hydrolase
MCRIPQYQHYRTGEDNANAGRGKLEVRRLKRAPRQDRRRMKGRSVIALFAVLSAFQLAAAEPPPGWDAVPAILARIRAPVFPNRDFPITDYGAKPDATTDCTEALRQAIAACHAAGGGRIIVSGGVFFTGAIHLDSGVNIFIAEGATLKFSPDPAKFLPVVFTRFEGTECMNYSPLIYAFEKENVAVTGKGTLDGSASNDTWWALPRTARGSPNQLVQLAARGTPVAERIFGAGQGLRPSFIQPYRCRNVLIEGVRIINSPMWEIHPVLSTNVTVRGVNISSHGPNNDGCNPESCRDVLIENSTFDTGDDCIAIKAGRDADGRRVNTPSENILVRGCTMKDGHGGVVIGSEVSGGVRNVFAEDCKMDSPNLQRALRLKSNPERGGFIENIYLRNIQVGRVSHSVLTIDLVYSRVEDGPFNPLVRNVVMQEVTVESCPRVLSIVGSLHSTIEGVRLTDCTFRGVQGPDILTRPGSITFQNVTGDALPQ